MKQVFFLILLQVGYLFSSQTKPAASTEKIERSESPEFTFGLDPFVTLVSKDKSKVQIPREVAQDPQVSALISQAFKPNAPSVTIQLPALSDRVLKTLVPIMVGMHELFEERLNGERRMGPKMITEGIAKLTADIKNSELAEYFNWANYLDSDRLLQALAWRYAEYLQHPDGALKFDLKYEKINGIYRELISQMYFLRFGVDADRVLFPDRKTKTTISLPYLIDFGRISLAFVKIFPQLGSDPNKLERYQRPPVMVPGRPRELNQQETKLQLTALSWAAYEHETSLYGLLKLRGINVNVRNSDGSTPLLMVTSNRYYASPEWEEYFKKNPREALRGAGSLIELTWHDRRAALHMTWELLAAGANPNIGTEKKRAANDPEIVMKMTPLVSAINATFVGVVELLIKYGVDVNEKIFRGETPLMAVLELKPSVFRNDPQEIKLKIAKELIEAGADVNAQDTCDRTALGRYLRHARPAYETLAKNSSYAVAVVKLLLDAHANPNISPSNQVPLVYVLHRIVELQQGKWPASVVRDEKKDWESIANMLLDAGADVYAKDWTDSSALDMSHSLDPDLRKRIVAAANAQKAAQRSKVEKESKK